MKSYFTFIFNLLGFIIFPSCIIAQDMHFSQFYNSPLAINPAGAGAMKEDMRFTSYYRDQWRSVGSPFKTILSSFDSRIYNNKKKTSYFGLGMQVYSDRAGENRMGVSMANLALSYHIRIDDENTIGAGIQGGAGQRSINMINMKWDSQFDGDIYDPSRPGEYIPNPNAFMFDFASGIMWQHQRDELFSANAGVSVYHIHTPAKSYYDVYTEPLHTRYVFYGNAEFGIDYTNYSVLPSFLFMKQGPFREIIAGGMFKYTMGVDSRYTGLRSSSAFYLGAFYRVQDAITLATRFDLKSDWSIGFSYDFNVSKLRHASSVRGGMEVSLIWKGVFDKNTRYKIKK